MIEEYDLRGENNEESEKELEQVLRPQLFQDFSKIQDSENTNPKFKTQIEQSVSQQVSENCSHTFSLFFAPTI